MKVWMAHWWFDHRHYDGSHDIDRSSKVELFSARKDAEKQVQKWARALLRGADLCEEDREIFNDEVKKLDFESWLHPFGLKVSVDEITVKGAKK